MTRLLRTTLVAALLAAPVPLLAQHAVVGDTVWVAAPAAAVGRVVHVTFTDAADRLAMLREYIALPTVDGHAWRVQDLVVAMDVGTRVADVTWRVVGPAVVVEAFEAEVRRLAERRPSVQAVQVRPLVVR